MRLKTYLPGLVFLATLIAIGYVLESGLLQDMLSESWIDEQVPMCGFCQSGMMIKATELLEATPSPTVDQIKTAFVSGASPHLCRCGTYSAIIEAVQRAATLMAPQALQAKKAERS